MGENPPTGEGGPLPSVTAPSGMLRDAKRRGDAVLQKAGKEYFRRVGKTLRPGLWQSKGWDAGEDLFPAIIDLPANLS
jgi:hypothetical protein